MGFCAAINRSLICRSNSKRWKGKKFGECWGRRRRETPSYAADKEDSAAAAVRIQAAFRGYMTRQALISQRKRLKSTIRGQPQSELMIPSSLKHLQSDSGTISRRNSNKKLEQIHPKPEIKLESPRKKSFMDCKEPQWGWSWVQQRMGAHSDIIQRLDMNKNQESPGCSTSAKTSIQCSSLGGSSSYNRRQGYMASTVSSRAKWRSPRPSTSAARRRLSFVVEDYPVLR